MMNYLSREIKADVASSLVAVGGILLVLVASEFSLPILMGVGAAVTAGTALKRVADFREKRHAIDERRVAVESRERELSHTSTGI